jgi:hypothetical protein
MEMWENYIMDLVPSKKRMTLVAFGQVGQTTHGLTEAAGILVLLQQINEVQK